MPPRDVDMADATSSAKPSEGEAAAAAPAAPAAISVGDIRKNLLLVARAVETGQSRLNARVLRNNTAIRTRVQPGVLATAISQLLEDSCPTKAPALAALSVLPDGVPSEALAMDVEAIEVPAAAAPAAPAPAKEPPAAEAQSKDDVPKDMDYKGAAKPVWGKKRIKEDAAKRTQVVSPQQKEANEAAAKEAAKAREAAAKEAVAKEAAAKEAALLKASRVLPEAEVYMALLAVTTLLREGKPAEAAQMASTLVERAMALNRRSLDWLSHKVIFYCAFANEQLGRLAEYRPQLMGLHRTCCLRHDDMGQATTLNLLLRSLLDQNLLDQAYKLASKTTFPEGASNNQLCRYLYYMGRVTALQLDYSDAFAKLTQSSRKAPADTGLGFRRAVNKLLVIVQLLLGEIPERSAFNAPGLEAALAPYLQLTRAVRLGDLREFGKTVEQHKATFQKDRTLTLIQRLAHNVVKAGLRKVNVSYSRISLQDVATKIRLDSVQSAEHIVAKAVRDGVIEAVIDHDNGYITSQEVLDVYATDEPQQAFHKRITFCLDVHNEAVRAMRYPPNAYKAELASARKGIEDKTEEELAKEIEDEMEDEGL